MAKDIKRHITHLKSKVVENNAPKLISGSDIYEGEIAVNYAKGYETLSIKNESGETVTFLPRPYNSARGGETLHPIFDGTGTAGGTNLSAAWSGNCEDIKTLYDGLTILYKINSAGYTSGDTLSINSGEPHKVLLNASTQLTTHYPVGAILKLTYDSSESGTFYTGSTTTKTTTGVWKIENYDSNTRYTAATVTPNKVVTASSVGTSAKYAREDHTHGIDLATGDANGQVKIAGTNVSVKGLGTAAYKAEGYFAGSGHSHTNMVTGSSLTANNIILGNGNSAIKDSGKSIETTLSSTLDTAIPTSKAVATYVTSQMTSVLTYKGAISANATLQNAHKVGDVYVVSSAGTYAGKACEVGDYLIANTARESASTVTNADWDAINGENQVENKSASLAAAGSSATLATVDGTNITVTTPSTWTGVAKVGTVTKAMISLPTGLSASTTAITSSGTFDVKLSNGYVIPTQASIDAKVGSGRTITTASGLTGGGNLSADRTIGLEATGTSGTYAKVVTDAYGRVTSGSATITESDVTNLTTDLAGKVGTARTITTTSGLTGGGNLSANRTIGLEATGTSGTYYSVKTDAYGRVISGNTSSPNTDSAVTQTNITTNGSYEVLLAGSTATATTTEGASKSVGLTYNPSTSALTVNKKITTIAANNFITGTGTAASTSGSGASAICYPAKWTFNKGITVADGDMFTIKIPVAGHAYGVYISLNNGTNYYPVVLNGTGILTTHYPVNTHITVAYESTGTAAKIYPLTGATSGSTGTSAAGVFRVVNYYDSNTTYTVVDNTYLRYGQYKAATVIYRYQVLLQKNETSLLPINTVSNSTETTKTLTTEEFDPFGNIFFYNVTATTDANTIIPTGRTYQQLLVDLRYSFNTGKTLIANKSVYMVCVPQSNGKAKLHTSPISQTLPTTDDGLIYIYLGVAYNTHNINLTIKHPVYQYKNGQLRQYVGSFGTMAYANTSSYSSATQVNTALSGKSDTGHTHDDRYYTEAELTGSSTTIVVSKAASATTAASAAKLANTSAVGSGTQPVFFTANGVPSATTYSLAKSVPSNAVFTDTATTLNGHFTPTATTANTKTATASSTSELSWGSSVVTGVTLSGDAKGHITAVAVSSGKLKTPVTAVTTSSTAGNISVNGSDVAVSGLGGAAFLNTGTTAGTVAAGNHTHNGYAITGRSITAGTGLTGGGNLSADRTLSLAMPTTYSAATYTSASITSSEPIVYCLCKFTSNLNGQVCPVSNLADGQQCVVIYNNTGSTDDVTVSFSTEYLGPEGGTSNTSHTEVKLTVKKYGYGEVNFINIKGTIFLRGV